MAYRLVCCFLFVSIPVGSLRSEPFTIQVRLDSRDVILGGSATFFCQFAGTPPLTVAYWSIGPTTPVPRAFRYSYNKPKTRFDILSVTMKDQGYYYCHATTQDGQKLNASAYLPVIDKFTIAPQSATVLEGQEAFLRCPVDKPEGVSVHWYFKGNPILSTNKNFSMEGTYQEVLRVPKAVRALNGTYKCYAQNSRWDFEAFPILIVKPNLVYKSEANQTAKPIIVNFSDPVKIGIIFGGTVGAVAAIAFICVFAFTKIFKTRRKASDMGKNQDHLYSERDSKQDHRNQY